MAVERGHHGMGKTNPCPRLCPPSVVTRRISEPSVPVACIRSQLARRWVSRLHHISNLPRRSPPSHVISTHALSTPLDTPDKPRQPCSKYITHLPVIACSPPTQQQQPQWILIHLTTGWPRATTLLPRHTRQPSLICLLIYPKSLASADRQYAHCQNICLFQADLTRFLPHMTNSPLKYTTPTTHKLSTSPCNSAHIPCQ